jgi:DNA-binding NtrC family response regulator
MATILVIDASESVRETVAILLGHRHRVMQAASLDASALDDTALLIVGLPLAPHEAAALCREIARTPARVPVVFLTRPDDVAGFHLGHPARRLAFLPKPFAAHTLHASVAAALAPRPAGRMPEAVADPIRFLSYPFIPRAAAALLRQAADVAVPLVLVGEPGSGGLDVARAIDASGGGAHALQIVACRELLPGRLLPILEASRGVFLERVDDTPRAAQHDVLALLRGDLGVDTGRVYASTTAGIEELAGRPDFLPELAYALGAFPVALAPLRDRLGDLDDLVPAVTTAIAARAGLEAVTYSGAAMARLRRYLWFGNVAELEAVLTRTLAARRPRIVAADDLVFLPEQLVLAAERPPPVASRPAVPPSAETPGAATVPRLEVLLGELAHELRNPMVTIKTFAQHLDSVLADPDVRARFSTLTSEAVGRMDALLERLLEFARFRAPQAAPVALGAVLDQALAEHGDELDRKDVRVERNGGRPGTVQADEAQVRFALRSLVEGLVGELVAHQSLYVTAPQAGTLELRARAEPAAAARLTAFVEGAEQTGTETPTLPFALAAALLERNGGHLRVRSGGDGTTVITVALTPAPGPGTESNT